MYLLYNISVYDKLCVSLYLVNNSLESLWLVHC